MKLFVLLFWMILLSVTIQSQESLSRRMAFIIGNMNYENVEKLKYTQNDAEDMKKFLESHGFEVEMILDGKKEQIEAALQRFGQKSKGKEASLFYFTGHGQQWGGKNYLYPVDVVIQPQDKIHQTAIEIGDVLSQMSLSRIKILILDACRTRIAGGANLKVELLENSLILYATMSGKTAVDQTKNDRNGIFCEYLMQFFGQEGVEITQALKNITVGVAQATNRKQLPIYESLLMEDFYMRPALKRPDPGPIRPEGDNQKFTEANLPGSQFFSQEISALKIHFPGRKDDFWQMVERVQNNYKSGHLADARNMLRGMGSFLSSPEDKEYLKVLIQYLYTEQASGFEAKEKYEDLEFLCKEIRKEFPQWTKLLELETRVGQEKIPDALRTKYKEIQKIQTQGQWEQAIAEYQKLQPEFASSFANARDYYSGMIEKNITDCKQSAFSKYEKFAGDSFEKKLWEDCRIQLDKASGYGDSTTIKYLRQTIQPHLEEIGAKKCRMVILGTNRSLFVNQKEKYTIYWKNTRDYPIDYQMEVRLTPGIVVEKPLEKLAVATRKTLPAWEKKGTLAAGEKKELPVEISIPEQGKYQILAVISVGEAKNSVSFEVECWNYGIPIEIWEKLGYSYKGNEILDMTSDAWKKFSFDDQNKFAKLYQKGYSYLHGLPLEKNIEVENWEFGDKSHYDSITKTFLTMILIPPGRYFFREQKVIISKHFYIGKYEVTQEQWSFVMSSNPLSNKNLAYPVQNVSWEDCQEFSRRVKLALPTEAQWEYACRAGCTGTYYFGDDSRVLDKYAWYHDSSGKTVGLLKPNAWGTYDMLGNVWEWCRDWHSPESLKKDMVDPEETKTSSHRVARGGSWGISDVASCGYRLNFSAGNRVDNSGFRVSSPAEE